MSASFSTYSQNDQRPTFNEWVKSIREGQIPCPPVGSHPRTVKMAGGGFGSVHLHEVN